MSKAYEPTDRDLIRWVGTWETEAEVNAAGYHFGLEQGPDWKPSPGEVVVVHSHGKFRRGIVTSVGRLRAAVELVTPTSIENARKGYQVYVKDAGWQTTHVLARTQAGGPVRFAQIAGAAGYPEMADGSFANATEPEPGEYGPEPEGCPGHESLSGAHMGESVYCNGSCVGSSEPAASEPEPAEQGSPGTVAGVAGSEIVRALEAVWTEIRTRHPELPGVVIITGSALIGIPRWGHFRADSWEQRAADHGGGAVTVANRHAELFIAGERLAVGAAETVQTMLHEAAHALAAVREIKDTSRQAKWHNRRFLALAGELGMEYRAKQADPRIGYSDVDLMDETRKAYADVIDQLDRALVAHLTLPEALREVGGSGGETVPRGTGHGGQGGEKDRNNAKLICECDPPRIIRASRATLELGSIVCALCDGPFMPGPGPGSRGAGRPPPALPPGESRWPAGPCCATARSPG